MGLDISFPQPRTIKIHASAAARHKMKGFNMMFYIVSYVKRMGEENEKNP
jgi:hypothetical protein